MDKASLQPAPATIRRCMGLLFLIISTYSRILTFWADSPPIPKYSGRSFSQMPIIARMVSRNEIMIPTGAKVRKNAAEE
ncbi:hypothetical protein EVA_17019 [gut metagenome]|uniref:Uncharacterized protein n=1 Tax=gut metagenome TaxID=749906 RepID=J9FKB1_9ZZZZ